LREVKVPDVKDGGWSHNAVDKFILEKLNAEGLALRRKRTNGR